MSDTERGDEEPRRETEATRRRAGEQDVAVELLAQGVSYAHTGQQVGRDERTIGRWMTDPGFAARVAERRTAWMSQVVGELVAAAPDAVLAIRRELAEAVRPADRLKAAALLLTYAQKFREHHEHDRRLRELEQLLGLLPRAAVQPAEEPPAGE
jgi:hypothetical protein